MGAVARHARRRLYIIIPTAAFVIIFANLLYGHAVFSTIHPQSIEKYSVYVHFVDGWQSYPGNMLFEVTNVWNDPSRTLITYFPDMADSVPYSHNQLQHAGGRSFVALEHHRSECMHSWQPVLYRYMLDLIRNQFEALQGAMYGGHPYALMYPDVRHASERTKHGYVQFVPICTAHETTSYLYSIKSNDPDLTFDAFFINSAEYAKFLEDPSLVHTYNHTRCASFMHTSTSRTCDNLSPEDGLLLWIPDSLDLALTRITVNLVET